MKKSLYIISALFVISFQSYGAGSSFLNAYETESITNSSFENYMHPFRILLNVGEAHYSMNLIRKAPETPEEDARDCAFWAKERTKQIAILESPEGIFFAGDSAEKLTWKLPCLNPQDIVIASNLYELLTRKETDGSTEGGKQKSYRTSRKIEEAIWKTLPSALGIGELTLKDAAAFDVFVFLAVVNQDVGVYDPPVGRLAEPPYALGTRLRKDVPFLADRFKRLLAAYHLA